MTGNNQKQQDNALLNEVDNEFNGLTLALSKGRILDETMPLLQAAGGTY